MLIPNYEVPANFGIPSIPPSIRFDDLLKIFLSMPMSDAETFQVVEAIFSTDTAITFFSKMPGRAKEARRQVFARVEKWLKRRRDDSNIRTSLVVLGQLYRMEEDGIPIDADKLIDFGKAYEKHSLEAVKMLKNEAKREGFELSDVDIHKSRLCFPDENSYLNDLLEKARKQIKHAAMLKPEKLKEYIRTLPDGSSRLMARWDIYGARSGRIQSRSFNVQGLPKEVRSACIVPKMGYSLICADYVSEELILIAVLTEDQALLENLMGGADLHKMVAAEVFLKEVDEVTDDERGFAKSVDFAFLYGASDRTLEEIIGRTAFDVTVSQVKMAINACFANVSAVIRKIEADGQIQLIDGEVISLEDIPKRYTAFNRMIQGSGAVILKAVVATIAEKLPSDAHICFLLHDEVVVEASACIEDKVVDIVSEVMTGALHRYGYEFDMPITISARKGGDDHGREV